MKPHRIFTSLAFAIAIFSNCKGVRNISSSGEAIENIGTFWETKNNRQIPSVVIPEKAWFHDSIGITQMCGFNTFETDTGKTITLKTYGYRFVDLKRKWVYEYPVFSDTAQIKRKYRYTDTTILVGGWKFDYRKPSPSDSVVMLSDTTINDITFKQCKTSYVFNDVRWQGMGLFRCDRKKTNFQMDAALSNEVGCPLVFFKSSLMTDPRSSFSTEIKFISNNLPDSVIRVFAAWKKNESTYPIQ
ncbi:MAG: hypothetical protein V4539_23720 [Bacteroidota bacterium]